MLDGDPVDETRGLKERIEGDVVVTGSITLTHAVLAAGLVDELRLFVYPAIQGRGRGLVLVAESHRRRRRGALRGW